MPGPPANEPSQEDRLLAAASYVSYFTGFWLIVPIAVYVYRREKSRFVAHHAIRALLFHLFLIPAFVLGMILSFGIAIGLATSADASTMRSHQGAFTGLFAILTWTAWILPLLIHFMLSVILAIGAFQGRIQTKSMMGRLAEGILGHDKGVAPPSN